MNKEKYCLKSIGIAWYCQYFSESVLVLAIVFTGVIGIGIVNTFEKYC